MPRQGLFFVYAAHFLRPLCGDSACLFCSPRTEHLLIYRIQSHTHPKRRKFCLKHAGQKSVKDKLPEQRKGPKRAAECCLKVPTHVWEQDAGSSSLPTRTTSEQALYRLLRLFYKSQSALTPLLILSKSQPLRWVVICCRRLAAFFDCGKRSGLNGACRKRWSQTGSQFSFQWERRPFAGAPVAGRPVRGDGHRQRPFGRKSRK